MEHSKLHPRRVSRSRNNQIPHQEASRGRFELILARFSSFLGEKPLLLGARWPYVRYVGRIRVLMHSELYSRRVSKHRKSQIAHQEACTGRFELILARFSSFLGRNRYFWVHSGHTCGIYGPYESWGTRNYILDEFPGPGRVR